MGNCITAHHNSNKIASLSPQDDETTEKKQKQKQKKSVRFVKRGDDDDEERGEDGGKRSPTAAAVRIRVLVTKNELREILKRHREELRSSSLEELVRAVKGRRMEDGGGNCEDGVWRPALETIPEDH
ncbi:unnamed protein product [Linum tenue]|uniref:Uncharacterized protein n=1 Tax=Linum tenue TaxID=586396 RepID=A0AAV0NP75_9ROSI|nr:unnamed protein product [Linum tenue]